MSLSQWLLVLVIAVPVGSWLLHSRKRQNRLDPHFVPAHLYGLQKPQMGCSQLLMYVLLVLVALSIIWLLLNAEFGGLVIHFSR